MLCLLVLGVGVGGGGRVNQACSGVSTTHGHITDCKLDSVVYAGVCVVILMWTCLVRAERSTADNFGCQATDSIPPQGEQKGITQTIILTPSQTVGCLTH